MNGPVQELVKRYRETREEKAVLEAKHREEIAPLKERLTTLENQTIKVMHKLGVQSLKTDSGTAYQSTKVSATVADRDTFKRFCLEEDAWEFADIRASKAAIRAMKEETGDLPPGINWREEVSVNFKK